MSRESEAELKAKMDSLLMCGVGSVERLSNRYRCKSWPNGWSREPSLVKSIGHEAGSGRRVNHWPEFTAVLTNL